MLMSRNPLNDQTSQDISSTSYRGDGNARYNPTRPHLV